MKDQTKNLTEEVHEISFVPALEMEESSIHKSKSFNPANVLRIEEPVTAHWSGVSGCCDQSTVDKEANKAYLEWVKNKMYEHRDLSWLRYGAGPGKGKCHKSKDPVTGVRTCRGYITMTCYIEFNN